MRFESEVQSADKPHGIVDDAASPLLPVEEGTQERRVPICNCR